MRAETNINVKPPYQPQSLDLQVKSIEALSRGLKVLRAVQAEEAISLADVHRLTGIPRATLLRILKTLCDDGWLIRHPLTKRFTAQPVAAAHNMEAWHGAFSQLCAPYRAALERQTPWPVNIAVPDGSQMVILDAASSCSLTPNYHALGYRPSMIDSAVGRCYLAFCPQPERQSILRRLERSGAMGSLTKEELQSVLAQTRTQGYSLKTRRRQGKNSVSDYGAVALPIRLHGATIGAITMVWLPEVVMESDILSRHLSAMGDAVKAIESALITAGIQHPSQLA
jgi:IclR family mhp operon transcriptional activator